MAEQHRVVVIVLAHNEQRRIAACLRSLPLGQPGCHVHVVVNGSTDRTAAIARAVAGDLATVHDWPEGGKARSWNRIVCDSGLPAAQTFVFVDGDTEVLPGAIDALIAALDADPQANAAAGVPRNGRRHAHYARQLVATHGMFGDLYALRGEFVARLRAAGHRLPEDLIGDDSLIGGLAKTDLGTLANWREERIVPCPAAGFLCEPTRFGSRTSLRKQYRRMVSYSIRHFQNRIITDILRRHGPAGLPKRMAELYGQWLPRFTPRLRPMWWWFDQRALAKMRRAMQAQL